MMDANEALINIRMRDVLPECWGRIDEQMRRNEPKFLTDLFLWCLRAENIFKDNKNLTACMIIATNRR